MKYITDQSVPEENTRCSSEIRKSLDGDSNLRNLLSAQMLFQPREGVAVGNLEFLHYHFTYYSQLLQRYLESKYSSEEQAAEQNVCLQNGMIKGKETVKKKKTQKKVEKGAEKRSTESDDQKTYIDNDSTKEKNFDAVLETTILQNITLFDVEISKQNNQKNKNSFKATSSSSLLPSPTLLQKHHFGSHESSIISELKKAFSIFGNENSCQKEQLAVNLKQFYHCMPEVYVRWTVKFVKALPAFSCLNSVDSFILFKPFSYNLLVIRGNFCIDHQRNGVRVFANNEADEVIFYNFNLGDQIKHSEAWKSMASYGKLLSLAMEDDPMIRDLLTAQQLFAPTPIRAGEGDPRLTLSCPEYVHYQRSLYLGLLRRYLQIKYRSKAVAMRKYYSLLELINRLTTYKETEIYLYQAEFGDLMQLSALELEISVKLLFTTNFSSTYSFHSPTRFMFKLFTQLTTKVLAMDFILKQLNLLQSISYLNEYFEQRRKLADDFSNRSSRKNFKFAAIDFLLTLQAAHFLYQYCKKFSPLEIVLHGDYATVACVTREAYIPVAGLCLLSAYILHRLYLPIVLVFDLLKIGGADFWRKPFYLAVLVVTELRLVALYAVLYLFAHAHILLATLWIVSLRLISTKLKLLCKISSSNLGLCKMLVSFKTEYTKTLFLVLSANRFFSPVLLLFLAINCPLNGLLSLAFTRKKHGFSYGNFGRISLMGFVKYLLLYSQLLIFPAKYNC
ncbi:hypothetical protein TYRP_014813 [Tyrophagus putrescentiae]|nr:hypothetical protein TYRP_014813 [Tyrophagus putrescentiae]